MDSLMDVLVNPSNVILSAVTTVTLKRRATHTYSLAGQLAGRSMPCSAGVC